MSVPVEPELQPYFRVAPEHDDHSHPTDDFTFTCKTCGTGWAFTFAGEKGDVRVIAAAPGPGIPTARDLVLDSESRNALLAHARSHRAPRLRLITQ